MSPEPGSARAPEQSAIPQLHSNARRTILLVEDEHGVREFVRAVLIQAGYTVIPASDGVEALELFRSNPFRFDLVLTDVMMPNRTGPELAEDIRAIAPSARILFMSGFAGGSPAHPVTVPQGIKVLAKPFSLDSLLHAIVRAIEK